MMSIFDRGTYVQRLWAIAIGLSVVFVVVFCGLVYRKYLEANYTPVRGTVLEVAAKCLRLETEIQHGFMRQTRERDVPCAEAREMDEAYEARRRRSSGGRYSGVRPVRFETRLSYRYVSPAGQEIFTGTAITTDRDNTLLRRGEAIMVWAHNTVPNRSEYAGRASYN